MESTDSDAMLVRVVEEMVFLLTVMRTKQAFIDSGECMRVGDEER